MTALWSPVSYHWSMATRNPAGEFQYYIVLLWLVAPMIATAKMWHRIGMDEQRRQCTCVAPRSARLATIVPLRGSAQRVERVDN